MKSKSENRMIEARKKSEVRKADSEASAQTQSAQAEGTAGETVWLLSADFFRDAEAQSAEAGDTSASLKQFNSEF